MSLAPAVTIVIPQRVSIRSFVSWGSFPHHTQINASIAQPGINAQIKALTHRSSVRRVPTLQRNPLTVSHVQRVSHAWTERVQPSARRVSTRSTAWTPASNAPQAMNARPFQPLYRAPQGSTPMPGPCKPRILINIYFIVLVRIAQPVTSVPRR